MCPNIFYIDYKTSKNISETIEILSDEEAKSETIVKVETPVVTPSVVEPVEKKADVIHRIRWGDTLWDISGSYYKNPWLYKKISNANGIKNPDHIISGTDIVIPEK